MRRLLALSAAALLASGCGSDSPSEPEVNLENGSMSARIDGDAWQATAALAVTYQNGILAFAGSDGSSRTIGMAVIATGTGTYPIGANEPTNANLTFGAGGTWSAGPFTGSGSLTLTSITQNSASGTFQYTMEPLPNTGASGTHTVTEGKFDLTF